MLDAGVPRGAAAIAALDDHRPQPQRRRSPSAIRSTSRRIWTSAARVVEERHERIKDIFQPGETRTIELNDGFAGPPFATARLRIVAAEALLPTAAAD